MTPLWTHTVIVALWGGLLALERRAFLQAMISRPLVAATSTGLILGDAYSGVAVGLIFELMHLGRVSMGAAQAEHETLPAIAGAAFAAEVASTGGALSMTAVWALAVLMFSPAGWAGRLLERYLDTRAQKYYRRAVSASARGEFQHAARQNIRAMWPQFVFYGLLSGGAVILATYFAPLQSYIPPRVLRGLNWAYPLMGVAAAAIAVQGTRAQRRFVMAAAGACAILAVTLGVLHGAFQ